MTMKIHHVAALTSFRPAYLFQAEEKPEMIPPLNEEKSLGARGIDIIVNLGGYDG